MRFPVIFALSVLASPAFAQDDFCLEVGNIAATVMQARQNGVTMSRALEAFNNIKAPNKEISAIIKSLIVGAYDSPAYSSGEMKLDAEREFSNSAIVACMKGS